MAKVSLKNKAFKLFDEGKNASSAEVKALGLKGGTRYVYYDNWKKSRAAGEEAKILSDESIKGYDETKAEEEGEEREREFEGEKKEKPLPDELREVSIPAEIIGFGLPIKVRLSVKTLALYQIASTTAENLGGNGLSLGDFLDQCAADFFVGRGSDLGLIKLEK